jgi:hypothetical protein
MPPKITIDILGDATKFTKATKDAQTTAQKFGKAIGTGLGIGAGIGAFNLLSSAVGGTVDFLKDAVQAGMEEQASIAKMTASLRANIPAWDGRTEAIEKVLKAQIDLGFSDDEQRDSLSLLVAATKDVTEAQNIQRIAMDLARFKGIDLKTATEALTKVEAGSYRILKSLGIVLKDGATQTEALAAVQKVAEGQAASYAQTTAGKLLVAQTKFGEKMDELGTILLPLVATGITKLVGGLDGLGSSFDKATSSSSSFEDKLTATADLVKWLNPATWGYNLAMDDLREKQAAAAASSELAAKKLTGMRGAVIAARASVDDLGDTSDDTAATITRNNDKQLVSYANLASFLLGKYNTDYDKAMGIQEARADIHNAKTNADRVEAYAQLEALGANSKADYAKWLAALEALARGTKGKVREAYNAAIADVRKLRDAAANPIIFNVVYQRRYTGKDLGEDGHAAAGGFHSGLTWVGEKGPELVNLPAGSYVNTAAKSRGMAGRAGGVVVNINEGAFIDGPSIDRLTNMIAQRLNYATGR